MTSEATPTAPSERIFTMDAIRGFALLGIFIMNLPYFGTSFLQGADGTHLWPAYGRASLDRIPDERPAQA